MIKYLFLRPFGTYVALCLNEKDFKKEWKRLNAPMPIPSWINEGANATVHNLERGYDNNHIVCLKVKKKISKHQIYALLVHEAVHVYQQIVFKLTGNNTSTRDVKIKSEFEDEVQAYTIQEISQFLMLAVDNEWNG